MRSVLGMCLNWKVLATLAVVGLGIVVIAPGAAWAALPLLLLAACPISMIVMGVTMARMRNGSHKGSGQ